MNIQGTRAFCLSVCIVMGAAASAVAFAADSSSKLNSGVNLVATLKNGPAMTPVAWKVFRLDATASPIESSRHSLSLPLEPGTYEAVASLDNVIRKRTFTIRDNSKLDVVIAMD